MRKDNHREFLSSWSRLYNTRKCLPSVAMVLLVVFIHFVIGCSYYKVTNAKSIESVDQYIQANSKYFIVHLGEDVWRLKNLILDNDKKELHGSRDTLSVHHQFYLTTDPSKSNRIRDYYKPGSTTMKNKGNPAYEVHFYIQEYMEQRDSTITIPLSAITKIEIYDKDVEANTMSAVFSTVGVIAGVIVIIGVIALLTKSSCPFVYVWDGHTYNFVGEMYGGAIYSSLERDDYMPLPSCEANTHEYELRISNELLEKQYTNQAELIVVRHPENTTALLDRYGQTHIIANPIAPVKALSDLDENYTDAVLAEDHNVYMFNEDNSMNKDMSSLTLTFPKPEDLNIGKLVLTAKNSYWLDYIYGEFNEQFGTFFNEFAESQKSAPTQKLNQWALDQGIPLAVYIETEKGWEFVDYFNVMGPLASRDLVMAIDVSKVRSNIVRIKLECGFMFWEIDYAAMDFSVDNQATTTFISARSAIDENGIDVTALLVATDNTYLIQPEVGNVVTMKFKLPVSQLDSRQSFFFHSRGYYEYIRDYKNVPDLFALSSFKKKAAFARFSKKQYTEFVKKPYLFNDAITANYGN